jgi:hypothetical protein
MHLEVKNPDQRSGFLLRKKLIRVGGVAPNLKIWNGKKGRE